MAKTKSRFLFSIALISASGANLKAAHAAKHHPMSPTTNTTEVTPLIKRGLPPELAQELATLRARELERDRLAVHVKTIVHGTQTTVPIRVSPTSRANLELLIAEEDAIINNLEQNLSGAYGVQDHRHANDSKLGEGTVLETVIETAEEQLETMAERFTWREIGLAVGAVAAIGYLAHREGVRSLTPTGRDLRA